MYAIVDKTSRECLCFSHSTNGYDPADYDFRALPTGDPQAWAWDVATDDFIPRPLTLREKTDAALATDSRWQTIKSATPSEIEAWLNANVTDLASARVVMKILVMAVQKLARTR